MDRTVTFETHDHVGVISLNRPAVLNAQNRRMLAELSVVLTAAGEDEAVRVVVLRGEGRAFCSGHDLAEGFSYADRDVAIAALEAQQEVTRRIAGLPKPIIAALHGYALGGGCEWALNCDIRVAAEGTLLGFPEVALGTVITNAGTRLLPLLVGLGRALDLVLTGELIEARKAEKWGLVSRVVPEAELLSATMDLAHRVARNPPLSLRLMKEALYREAAGGLDATLRAEIADAMKTAFAQGDAQGDDHAGA